MKFVYDHDLHIHSQLSTCSADKEQTPQRILRYAEENGLKTICLTDHFWDSSVPGVSDWYRPQDFAHVSSSKPLPTSEGIRFMFGCETELDRFLTLGISKESLDLFDFIIIPTTHMHSDFAMTEEDAASVDGRVRAWIRRLDAVLNMDLPFRKIGIAHLACFLIAPTKEEYHEVLKRLPEEELRRLFTKAAKLGVGIELNSYDMNFEEEDAAVILRPFAIAKECGCKFYCGSDSHHPATFDIVKRVMERAVDMLGLEESDKFILA